jgi:hypothetical protein
MLQSPLSKFMAAVQGTGQKLVAVLGQVKNQKS